VEHTICKRKNNNSHIGKFSLAADVNKVNRVRVTQRGWDALNRTSTAPFTANQALTVYIDYYH
jgi:hypothetical protein